MAKLKYRLGLDLGANSLGWCVYRLDDEDEPVALHRLGSRIFSDGRDPKSLASLAADRRLARQSRRRRDRVLKRRHRLINGLVQFGLMPADAAARKALQAEDPYALRAKGLDAPLTTHEVGRALYHLARKRGFKSSRKDRGSSEAEKETGKVNLRLPRSKAGSPRRVVEQSANIWHANMPSGCLFAGARVRMASMFCICNVTWLRRSLTFCGLPRNAITRLC